MTSWFTTAQVANVKGVSTKAVHDARKRDDLPGATQPAGRGTAWLYPVEAVEAWQPRKYPRGSKTVGDESEE